ncbi:MAG TPA: 3-hydroxyacyl-CoA dehydrogenase NAD-binding domain-containing protein [Steroidobacteraceae bacterium]|jgi:3-hydroxyacyl-CoA dehydrogenase/enoyl-CoA hydratase/3-hydroxybutyryl-CoA epimerase|nr:3-hydroxyacyl-CoA dehydrogenase NAD-binding domain-containing protein [Steroidobacteraceae bacterium]
MQGSSWTVEIDAERIAWLTCDTPGASTNVLSAAVLQELSGALSQIAATKPIGVVVRSGKRSGFVAGADIKEFLNLRTPEEAYALIRSGQRVLDQLENLPCPSVAAIHGFALGGGLELALAATYRIGVDDASLSLGLPEVQLGIHPGFGGTVRTVRLIGVRPAFELMLSGKPFRGARALEVGLLDQVVPAARLEEAARQLLHQAPPRKSAPFVEKLLNMRAMRPFIARQAAAGVAAKVAREHYPAPYAIVDLWHQYGATGAESYEAEARSIARLMCTPTSRNLVRVFLLQTRLKSLGGKPGSEFHHVHVIGAGVMGGDIAAWCALRGMTVTLQDRSIELIAPALARARALFDKRLREPGAAAAAAARLSADVAGEGVASADAVIEAIVENVDAKRALYAEIEPRLRAGAVLATNTSSIRLEVLAEKLRDAGRLVGIHFFNPVPQMQLVEIVRGAATDPESLHKALWFTRKLDKLPLPCKSSPGFVVNRILMPYLNEALFALSEGIPAAVIDEAGTRFGMPVGPIELADVVGLDVTLHVGRVLAEGFERRVPEILVQRVAAQKLGRKSGEGFYVWRDGQVVRTPTEGAKIPADLEDRLILPMVNEAVAVLREGVVEDADLLDAGAIFATGFAPFRGGPLQYARTRGIAEIVERLNQLSTRYGERFRPDGGWSRIEREPAPL